MLTTPVGIFRLQLFYNFFTTFAENNGEQWGTDGNSREQIENGSDVEISMSQIVRTVEVGDPYWT